MLVNTIVLTALLPCLTKILFSENFYNFAFRKIFWIFAAKDAGRLAPFKDDKLKYAEIMPFQTGSNYFLSAKPFARCDMLFPLDLGEVNQGAFLNFPQLYSSKILVLNISLQP